MIKKTFFLFTLMLVSVCSKAQSKTNQEDVFKMQLFLNKKNSVFRTMEDNVVKNDSLYLVFKNVLSLNLEKLKLDNSLGGVQEEFEFYKLLNSDIKYNRELIKDESKYLAISGWQNDFFILAINKETGVSYRLAGFDTNDFLAFLNDFKEAYLKSNFKKLKTAKFIKGYKVESLNFDCLYKGLMRKEIDRDLYPCLKRCSEPMKIG